VARLLNFVQRRNLGGHTSTPKNVNILFKKGY
jgi:hypothetical protein